MRSATAVIIGGGVLGLSTAYHLARKRFGKVILLDKGPIGDGSSSRAAGIITGLLWSEPGVLARKKSLALFRELSDELEGYRFHNTGCLNLFDRASWEERTALFPLYERLGAPFEVVDAVEIGRRWPALTPPADCLGLYDPLGGYSEPDDYIPALAKRCRELGVEVRENEKVTGFLKQGERLAGVQTANETIEADAVLCTTYAWTHNVIASLAMQLPVKAFVHQRCTTEPLPAPVAIPAVNANPMFGYIRPAAGNRVLAGLETADRKEQQIVSTDFRMTEVVPPPQLRETLTRNLASLLPVLDELAWETERVGLLTFSMDGEPIMGPVAALPGFYVAVAFHSGGFAYNPVAGLLMAQMIADGKTEIDISAFSPDRFSPEQTADYLATTIPQKEAVRRRH